MRPPKNSASNNGRDRATAGPSDKSGGSGADLSGKADYHAAADDFRLLGDATRLEVFWLLCHQELSVAGIASAMGMSSPAISHHLRALRDTGLVVARRNGREVLYQAAETERCELLHRVVESVLDIECPQDRRRGRTQTH
ncbi:MAG: winged helix-turn-helix transcriptional regulator [Olsenella sp.]|nr:winged helix-turn-helix transcriptional regulator [Olsenella sp.]